MSWLAPLRELDSSQRHTVFASFLGWTLDAFDFFLLVFVLGDIASDFHVHAQYDAIDADSVEMT